MDQNLVYAKTPTGDEAVRQSTRVVQRNLRMVLVQVDGKLTVGELGAKVGDPRLVENALRGLEEGGFIAPTLEAVSVWEQSKVKVKKLKEAGAVPAGPASVSSFSSFASGAPSAGSVFSTFGKPVLPVAEEDVAPAPEPPERTARRRLSPKAVAGGFVALLGLLLAVAFLFPYDQFKPAIEAELRNQFQSTVAVDGIRLRYFPTPSLQLSGVRIGEQGESSIDQIRLHSPLSLLGSGVRELSQVDVIGGRLAADHLVSMRIFGASSGRVTPRVVFRQLKLDRVTVAAGGLDFSEFGGEINFHSDGQIAKTNLQTLDRSLRIGVQTSNQGPLLTFEGLGWRPSEQSALTLDTLQAKGLLQKGRLVLQSFDANTMGGVVKGSLLVDWTSGLALVGDAALERLECRRVTSLFAPGLSLDGELTGSLRLRGSGRDWQSMWASAEAVLDALVVRGMLQGVDLGEAARRGPGSVVRAGSTKFDRLSVKISVTPRQVIGRDLVMNAGMFTASGQFAGLPGRQVESSLLVNLQTSVSSLTLPVRVSGTLPNLQATVSR